MSDAIDDIREQIRREEDRYWSLFLAIVYSTDTLKASEIAQIAADYYREGTRVMKEITE